MKKSILNFCLMTFGVFTFIGCNKQDMSKYATKEELANYATKEDNQTKVYDFNFTIGPLNPGYIEFPAIERKPNDIVMVYKQFDYDNIPNNDVYSWVQLPATFGEISYVLNYNDTKIFIDFFKSTDGTIYTFSGFTTHKFKVVVLSFSQLEENPNVDLNNYAEVANAFNLD